MKYSKTWAPDNWIEICLGSSINNQQITIKRHTVHGVLATVRMEEILLIPLIDDRLNRVV